MYFFDLVHISDDSLDALAGRLGYKKMFHVGEDVELVDTVKDLEKKKMIVRSENNEVVAKMLRQNGVIGLLPVGNSVSKKTLEMIRANEKTLFLPISPVICADGPSRTQALIKMRGMIRNALIAKANLSLVSMAKEKECVISSIQMLETANFLGLGQERAKEALSRLGGLI